MTDTRIKALLIDDQVLVREALAHYLRTQGDTIVCKTCGTDAAGEHVEKIEPDIILVNLIFCGMSGLELMKSLLKTHPCAHILTYAPSEGDAIYGERALLAGAAGHVMCTDNPADLLEAIWAVFKGDGYIPPQMHWRITKKISLAPKRPVDTPDAILSDRELEIVWLIGEGISPKRIADRLRISLRTVESYRDRIRDKLGLIDGAELLMYAIHYRESCFLSQMKALYMGAECEDESGE